MAIDHQSLAILVEQLHCRALRIREVGECPLQRIEAVFAMHLQPVDQLRRVFVCAGGIAQALEHTLEQGFQFVG
ncbi:hypothetical protein D3C78_1691150 [compost metagenome]